MSTTIALTPGSLVLTLLAMTNGVVVEVTSIYTDTQLGVLERRCATKSTAGIEVTVHADRADEWSPIVYSVRFSQNLSAGWSRPRRTDYRPRDLAAAYREADRQWAEMLGWLRQVEVRRCG